MTKHSKWKSDDVIAEFDSNWAITMEELAKRSGWTVAELKSLLMS